MPIFALIDDARKCICGENSNNWCTRGHSVIITQPLKFTTLIHWVKKYPLWCHSFMGRKGQKMVLLKKNKSNIINYMRKNNLKQRIVLVLYMKERICVIQNCVQLIKHIITVVQFYLNMKYCNSDIDIFGNQQINKLIAIGSIAIDF